jgi:hypothetical protein
MRLICALGGLELWSPLTSSYNKGKVGYSYWKNTCLNPFCDLINYYALR